MNNARNILSTIIEKISLVLAFAALGLLTYLVTGPVEHVNLMTYEDMPVLYLWNPPLKILFVVLLAILTAGMTIALHKLQSTNKCHNYTAPSHTNKENSPTNACTNNTSPNRNLLITTLTLLPPAIFGIWWVLVDEFPVAGDARAVADMAKAIAYGTDTSEYIDYINTFANQRGIVILEALFYKVFNDNAYIILRFLNLAMILATIQALSLIAGEIWQDEKITILTRILLSLFVPFVLFANLVYGTVPSICLLVLGFLFALKLCRKNRVADAIFTVLSFTLAMYIYQGAMIAVLATIIYLLFMDKKVPSKKLLITAILLVLSMLFTGKIANFLFSFVTGLELGGGMPAIAWIYMGLSAGDGVNGAGSYNDSHSMAWQLNNFDTASTSSYCKSRTIEIIGEYLTGKRPLLFFYEKTRCQWTNSMFDSTQMTQFPSYENFVLTDSYRHLLSGKIMQTIILYADIFQMMVYLLAFLWVLRTLFKKDMPNKAALLVIFFVGGFLFQLMWEQKARYCMTYFMVLIPLAACELTQLATAITAGLKKLTIRKSEK
ncbi:MAG: glycosyltransferase family 39 protein [Butyrivibrio sp.]|uniref:glycosyltransferase family 39 protein n=1 Tax=Butyrivibrio sp. TaxID=28121 RepID=UPI0025BECB2D|nr:glycosyltransferase family 39 protein [Butyrivibrio sp.]MBQ6588697.1 glycosyltransferase family 39 protein [Butyrivibrio sp.]